MIDRPIKPLLFCAKQSFTLCSSNLWSTTVTGESSVVLLCFVWNTLLVKIIVKCVKVFFLFQPFRAHNEVKPHAHIFQIVDRHNCVYIVIFFFFGSILNKFFFSWSFYFHVAQCCSWSPVDVDTLSHRE